MTTGRINQITIVRREVRPRAPGAPARICLVTGRAPECQRGRRPWLGLGHRRSYPASLSYVSQGVLPPHSPRGGVKLRGPWRSALATDLRPTEASSACGVLPLLRFQWKPAATHLPSPSFSGGRNHRLKATSVHRTARSRLSLGWCLLYAIAGETEPNNLVQERTQQAPAK
jgi:hypothetical protein